MTYQLLDRSSVDSLNLRLDTVSYHVYDGTRDITNIMRQSDKVAAFPHFDRAADNERSANEAAIARGDTPANPGSTSTLGIFFHQIFTEPFKAPIESLTRSFTNLDPQTKAVVKTGVVLLTLGLVVYGIKLLKDAKQ